MHGRSSMLSVGRQGWGGRDGGGGGGGGDGGGIGGVGCKTNRKTSTGYVMSQTYMYNCIINSKNEMLSCLPVIRKQLFNIYNNIPHSHPHPPQTKKIATKTLPKGNWQISIVYGIQLPVQLANQQGSGVL